MKRTIAIACGGDTSEFEVSLRSAQGIYSFIDKEKYTLYIVEMHGLDWHVQLPDGTKAPVDSNDFSFRLGGEKVVFDFVYITIQKSGCDFFRIFLIFYLNFIFTIFISITKCTVFQFAFFKYSA